ncbi:MAG: hypothetical protein BKP49_08280 [Treponema sp. CETP13]|nr:MAG: hypothetical protein BKP49_08280 [Treponema sp. CETP13]
MKFYTAHSKIYFYIIAISIFLFFTQFTLFASTYNSSTTGVTATFTPSSSEESANLITDAYVATHFQFANFFTLDGKVSINTDNILENSFYNNTAAYFTIDEISGTYSFDTAIFEGQLTAFVGSFESPGTDIFGKKYLGIQNIIPPILYPETALESIPIYSIEGIGLAFGAKFSSPIATGLYVYYNDVVESTDSDETEKYVNIDTRIAKVSDNFFIDFCLGTSFPFETEVVDNELYISTHLDLHAMTTMVIGGNPYTNMFIQAGLSDFQVQPTIDDDYISLDDIFIFLEPRFATKSLHYSFSLFCIPEDKTETLEYIDNSVGTALSITSNPMLLFNSEGTIGGTISASVPNPAIEDYSVENIDFQMTPYLDLKIQNNNLHTSLHTSLHIYPLRYNDIGTMFLYTMGYKIQI